MNAVESLEGYRWHDLSNNGRCFSPLGLDVDTFILGGIGDGEEAIEYTVIDLNSDGYNVAGLSLSYSDGEETTAITTLIKTVPEAIGITSEDGRPTTPKNLVGISKGGGEALLTAYLLRDEKPRLLGNIAIINAVGPGNLSMGDTPMDRLNAFNKRRKIQQQRLTESDDIIFQPDIKGARSNFNGLVNALSRDDCAEIIQALLDNDHRIVTLFGNEDPIFTAAEAQAGLSEIEHPNLIKMVIEGDHASLFRKLGQDQVRQALDLLNS